jgi:hypothetical protein
LDESSSRGMRPVNSTVSWIAKGFIDLGKSPLAFGSESSRLLSVCHVARNPQPQDQALSGKSISPACVRFPQLPLCASRALTVNRAKQSEE